MVMFVVDIQMSKAVQTYKRKLEDFERDIEKPALTFERNEILADLVADIDELGSLIYGRKDSGHIVKQLANQYSTDSKKILIDR